MSANLEGIRVVSYTHWVAGPAAAQILAEWGADVIHVERRGVGDVTRGNPPIYKGESLYYRSFNRDNRSLSLDITKPEGLETLLALIEKSDVFLTNFTVSFLEKHGLTTEKIKARNPRAVICYISGFGLNGRYKDKKALDMVMQAMSGMMALTGEPDGRPMKSGNFIGDYIGGYQAVIGILLALQGRERTGLGQVVDIAITDCLISTLEWRIPEYRLTGRTPGRVGNRRPTTSPNNLYKTADGYVYIAASNQKFYERLCEMTGDPAMKAPEFADNPLRVKNQDALDPLIEAWTRTLTTDEVTAILEEAGLPAGPLMTPEQLSESGYLEEKGLITELDDPVLGPMPFQLSPIKMERGAREEHTAPPRLGGQTDEVLKEWLGFDGEKIAELREKGAI